MQSYFQIERFYVSGPLTDYLIKTVCWIMFVLRHADSKPKRAQRRIICMVLQAVRRGLSTYQWPLHRANHHVICDWARCQTAAAIYQEPEIFWFKSPEDRRTYFDGRVRNLNDTTFYWRNRVAPELVRPIVEEAWQAALQHMRPTRFLILALMSSGLCVDTAFRIKTAAMDFEPKRKCTRGFTWSDCVHKCPSCINARLEMVSRITCTTRSAQPITPRQVHKPLHRRSGSSVYCCLVVPPGEVHVFSCTGAFSYGCSSRLNYIFVQVLKTPKPSDVRHLMQSFQGFIPN